MLSFKCYYILANLFFILEEERHLIPLVSHLKTLYNYFVVIFLLLPVYLMEILYSGVLVEVYLKCINYHFFLVSILLF